MIEIGVLAAADKQTIGYSQKSLAVLSQFQDYVQLNGLEVLRFLCTTGEDEGECCRLSSSLAGD